MNDFDHPCGVRDARRATAAGGNFAREHYMLVVVAAMLLGGCVPMHSFPSEEVLVAAPREPVTYAVGPGDTIRVSVYLHEDLSGSFRVDGDGRMSLPLVRGLDVRGLTLTELEELIGDKLAERDILNPRVSAQFETTRDVCVLGEVEQPLCFTYVEGLTVAKAISRSSGFTYRAYREAFVVTRTDGTRLRADLSTPLTGGDALEVFERYF